MQLNIPPRTDPDLLARNLMYMGRLARSMPPAWDGAAVAHPLGRSSAGVVGKILPGRGLYLDCDLKNLGIMRPLPGVYEYSLTQKLIEILRSERGAITTYDGIINARANGKADDVTIGKVSITTVASVWSSLFRAGGLPDVGTYTNIPGGAAPDRSNVGAWSLGLSNPTGGDKKFLLTFGFSAASQINWLILVDLLVAAGNISCNSSGSPYPINSTALTRSTTGAGVLMTFEVTTALSATADNITVSKYTNQSGTANQTTAAIALTTSAVVQRLLPIALGPFVQLATGDYGVRSVEQVTMSAGNTGVLALNLYFPLMFVPGVGANAFAKKDSTVEFDSLTELVQASGVLGCLTAYVLSNTTSSGIFTGFMRTCAG